MNYNIDSLINLPLNITLHNCNDSQNFNYQNSNDDNNNNTTTYIV